MAVPPATAAQTGSSKQRLASYPTPCPGAMSAKLAYQRTWVAVRSSFGAGGMPSPRVLFVNKPGREMRVTGNEQGYRQVEILETLRLALAGADSCTAAISARECLIHEFAHVFQA